MSGKNLVRLVKLLACLAILSVFVVPLKRAMDKAKAKLEAVEIPTTNHVVAAEPVSESTVLNMTNEGFLVIHQSGGTVNFQKSASNRPVVVPDSFGKPPISALRK